ncbi:MAG: HTH-type transcriptional regulator BetI [Alphaproteobacteria bacterium]|nr:MAG: HTH-type transcriptional regulator BetI [Alphaproteobacteria bacterium]
MPRIGAEPLRRQSLIDAAIATIGEQGSLDVSVKRIAGRAGMSPALAFHYFGDKDEIILATMRHLLREFSRQVTEGLKHADGPRGRVEAVIEASFGADQFARTTIAAWLVFYLHAYSSPPAARLLGIYTRRLRSNLVDALRQLLPVAEAAVAAETLAAIIDGLYVRHALRTGGPDAGKAIRICRTCLDRHLGLAEGERA